MTGAVLSGYRHELQVYPSKLSGHVRAIVWAAIVAAVVVGVGL